MRLSKSEMAKILKTDITDENLMKKTLQEEGFFNIFTWHDRAGTKYPEHTHPHYEVRWIVDGVLVIEENGKRIELHPGDRMESLPNTPHSAYCPTDVTYVCGSR
ncbi:MAG: cupin domain-containing protein [Epsilonproteobacteria bacterium]|nr:cupin domain-containing protein [Campylobacterota bacterium]